MFVVVLRCLGLGVGGALVVSGLRGVWFAVWYLCLASVGLGFGFGVVRLRRDLDSCVVGIDFLGFGGWFVWDFGRGVWFWYMCFARLVGLRVTLVGFVWVTLTIGFGVGYGVHGGFGWCRGWFRLACGRGLGFAGCRCLALLTGGWFSFCKFAALWWVPLCGWGFSNFCILRLLVCGCGLLVYGLRILGSFDGFGGFWVLVGVGVLCVFNIYLGFFLSRGVGII